MEQQSLLLGIEQPINKPNAYNYLLIFVIISISVLAYVCYDGVLAMLAWDESFTWFTVYNYACILVYPLIGITGYMIRKKFGWFILSHYFLSASVALSIGAIATVVREKVVSLITVLQVGFTLLNVLTVYLLFKKSMQQYFSINSDDVRFLRLLLLAFTFSWCILYYFSDKQA